MVKEAYKECGEDSMTSSGYRDVKECGDGDCHCLFVTSGYRDLCQGVWGWRLSLFVCDF